MYWTVDSTNKSNEVDLGCLFFFVRDNTIAIYMGEAEFVIDFILLLLWNNLEKEDI